MEPLKILLVEDNEDDVELTLVALRENNVGNTVEVAHDGVEAIAKLDAMAADSLPAFVLLDLKLPKVDGLGVLQHIRSHEKTALLPVVMLTSSDMDRDIVESYRLGTNSYVRKPVDFVEFVEVARQLGFYWLLINESPGKRGIR